jgi:putative transposase
MHAHRLRKGRYSASGQIYLITTVTINRQPFFADWHCGRQVVRTLREHEQQATTLAFVVMPDHLHWLMQLKQGNLPRLMQQVKATSAWHINQALARTGPLWQHGYHDHALRKEEDLASIAPYIVANPLRAGLVRQIGDYPLWDAVWL